MDRRGRLHHCQPLIWVAAKVAGYLGIKPQSGYRADGSVTETSLMVQRHQLRAMPNKEGPTDAHAEHYMVA